MCNVHSKGKMNLETDKPPEQPAPSATVAAAAAAERASENDYYSIRKQVMTAEDVDNDKNDEDPLYESICGETASSDVTPEPKRVASYKDLCDPELGESSSL